MSNFKLNDFEVGKVYGIYTEETGKVEGILKGKQHFETEGAEADMLVMCVPNNDNLVYIMVDKVTDYYCFVERADSIKETRLFNPELEKYGIDLGYSVEEILDIFINHWDEYKDEEKKFFAEEIVTAMTSHNLADLITAVADYKNRYDGEYKRCIELLKKQKVFLDKYNEFKKSIPDGLKKMYDTFLFEVCGLMLEFV